MGDTESRVSRALAREWDARLKQSGYRDIEYEDGSILGIRLQEANRAPTREELEATEEYFSRALEWLHARAWDRVTDRRIWELHAEGASVRDIAKTTGTPQTTVQRALDRLRGECAAWWTATRDARENAATGRGRPRREAPRRERVEIALTREERHAILDGARRATDGRCHTLTAWMRRVLIEAAAAVPRLPGRRV